MRKRDVNHDKKLRPLSLDPLSPERALSAFMKADPDKVDKRLKKSGVKKDKK